MKIRPTTITIITAILALTIVASHANPRLNSWFTDKSGQYARIYPNTTAESNGNSVTTWNRGAGVQDTPTYAGVHEISHTTDWVYIRSTNLASHIMGPWLNAGGGLFPNYPANAAVIYRLPLNPADPTTITSKTLTGGGPIGYFVNGVAMFDTRDAFSYSVGSGGDVQGGGGDGAWNRDAYVNESVTFDKGNAHQAGLRYHYHTNPPGLRNELGDSVDFTAPNTYTENFNGNHSPILAWVRDGIPVYGPYGYSHPTDSNSTIRRMTSGFQLRTDIAANGSPRTSWPAWATALYGTTGQAFANGPNVGAGFPLGRYMEDNDYKGNLGLTQYTETVANSVAFNPTLHFDLNEYNARWCVTPEFPAGTWAYFVCIEADGTPVFPYNIGRAFFGDPVGDVPNDVPDSTDTDPHTMVFEGGPEVQEQMRTLGVVEPSGDVTVIWDGIENATYEVLGSPDMQSWTVLSPTVTAGGNSPGFVHTGQFNAQAPYFYKVNKTSIAPFDDTGFDYDSFYVDGPSNQNLTTGGGVQTVVIHLNPADAANIPASFGSNPTSVLIGGQPAAFVERLSRYVLVVTIDPDAAGLANGNHNISVDFGSGAVTAQNIAVVAGVQNNVLLMIVDDWAWDSSPVDNVPNPAGTTFPTMATLQDLAATGVRFTNGYTQPVCSPMRAAILTGRQAWRTGVGNPGDVLLAAETTLPEAFTADGSPYSLASFGKWHLGNDAGPNDDLGYSQTGGWPEFIGITGGGVPNNVNGYTSWRRNDNGTVTANYPTYSTSDQVNVASAFIQQEEANGNPWFVWLAFNAPHTPFHEPPAGLLQGSGGTTNRELYEKALEALDTEMGRLFTEMTPGVVDKTNIILVGDNGTPGGVVQAPYSQGHAKGSIYEGGIHVPFIIKGPAVTAAGLQGPNATSDRFVHVTDLFPTILEMAGVTDPGTGVDGNSLMPILDGTDTLDRCVVTEVFNNNNPGRSLRMESDQTNYPGSNPDYKLIIRADPNVPLAYPSFEFYNVATDIDEQSPLNIASLNATEQAAFDALVQKDTDLGGGYGDFPTGDFDVVYIEIVDPPGQPNLPQLANGQGNPIHPTEILINGTIQATYIARVDSGVDVNSDYDDTPQQDWVKCLVSPAGTTITSTQVTFTIQGNDRVFPNNSQVIVKP
ncbi:MAG: sulfatase-like hydrolase/transferase [Verrucomicrobiota bacterium]